MWSGSSGVSALLRLVLMATFGTATDNFASCLKRQLLFPNLLKVTIHVILFLFSMKICVVLPASAADCQLLTRLELRRLSI